MRAAVAKPLVSALPRAGGAPGAGQASPGHRNAACKGSLGPASPRPALPVPQPCTSLEPQAGAAQQPQRAAQGPNIASRAALGPPDGAGGPAAAAHASAARPTRPLLPRRWARPPPRLAPPAAPWRCVPLPAPTGCPAPTSPPTWRTASCPAAVSDLQSCCGSWLAPLHWLAACCCTTWHCAIGVAIIKRCDAAGQYRIHVFNQLAGIPAYAAASPALHSPCFWQFPVVAIPGLPFIDADFALPCRRL